MAMLRKKKIAVSEQRKQGKRQKRQKLLEYRLKRKNKKGLQRRRHLLKQKLKRWKRKESDNFKKN